MHELDLKTIVYISEHVTRYCTYPISSLHAASTPCTVSSLNSSCDPVEQNGYVMQVWHFANPLGVMHLTHPLTLWYLNHWAIVINLPNEMKATELR
jgi:hypothetical protein